MAKCSLKPNSQLTGHSVNLAIVGGQQGTLTSRKPAPKYRTYLHNKLVSLKSKRFHFLSDMVGKLFGVLQQPAHTQLR